MVPGSDLIFSGLPSRLWLWGGLVCGSYLVGYWLTDALPHLLHPNTPSRIIVAGVIIFTALAKGSRQFSQASLWFGGLCLATWKAGMFSAFRKTKGP